MSTKATTECQTLSLSKPGSDYNGTVSVTISGRTCQNWADQTPHSHSYKGFGVKNYCRNSDDRKHAPGGVWCYTVDPNKRWEYCSQIKNC